MAVWPCVAMWAELVTPSWRALVTLSRRGETELPMDWSWAGLCDCVCATERRSRRSSVSWDSRAELFFWDWEIWVRSQRIRATKIMEIIRKTEFMGYYFTLTRKNSPQRARRAQIRKRFSAVGSEIGAPRAQGKPNASLLHTGGQPKMAVPRCARDLPGKFRANWNWRSAYSAR